MKRFMLSLGILAILLAPSVRSQPDSLKGLNLHCGIDLPMDPWDSVSYPYWDLAHIAKDAVLSPDGNYLAFRYEYTWPPFFEGVEIIDMRTHALVKYLPGEHLPKWHPTQHKLLTPFLVYDLETGIETDLPVREMGLSYWSTDGRFIYYSHNADEFLGRSTADGKNLEWLASQKLYQDFKPLTDSTFFRFGSEGYQIHNINTGKVTDVRLDWMSGIGVWRRWSVSPDGRFIAGDFRRNPAGRFLGVVDLRNNTLKTVLPMQRLAYEYYPSWTTRGTLIVSYACRLDSVYGVWEVDTNGVFLRQLFGKQDFDALTSIPPAPVLEHGMSVRSLFPQPCDEAVLVEFVVRTPGQYSLSILDMLGRETAYQGFSEWFSTGVHTRTLRTGSIVPGLYLLRMSINNRNSACAWIRIVR